MRWGWVAALIAVSLFLTDAVAQSKRNKSGIEQPTPTVAQQKSPEEQRGTEQSPFIVKIAPAQKTETERDEEAQDRERMAESQRKKDQADTDLVKYTAELARFTKYLFAATVVLGIATVGLLIAAFFQSRYTKRSIAVAELNVKAVMNAERAHLFITIGKETISELSAKGEGWKNTKSVFDKEIASRVVDYSFKNVGKTAAILKEISHQIIAGPTFPSSPTYTVWEQTPEEIVIEAGKPTSTLTCTMVDALTMGDAVAVFERKTTIWFYGYITFDDAFGREHRFEYRCRYRRGLGRLRLEYYREFTKEAQA